MARGVDEVENIFLAVNRILHLYGMTFNRDATLTLQLHVVKHLRLQVFLGYSAGVFEQTVGQSALAVVDMCNDTKVSYIFHLQ